MSVEGIGATATGVEDPENSGIVVSPNPASNELNLRLPAGFFNSTVRIVNALGKCCTEQQLYASGSPIDVGNLAAGCYQVFVESNGRQVVLEVMIIH